MKKIYGMRVGGSPKDPLDRIAGYMLDQAENHREWEDGTQALVILRHENHVGMGSTGFADLMDVCELLQLHLRALYQAYRVQALRDSFGHEV